VRSALRRRMGREAPSRTEAATGLESHILHNAMHRLLCADFGRCHDAIIRRSLASPLPRGSSMHDCSDQAEHPSLCAPETHVSCLRGGAN
jgi:hypothetical protein